MAECPNRTLANMMRCFLHGANLGPEYWSWALLNAVYLKNLLPHRATKTTPFQAYTGEKPHAAKLRVFGCPIISRLPGRRPAKLDAHVATGIFLGYTVTDNNIYYKDNVTHRIKTATQVTFDEAGYTVPRQDQSLLQYTLQSVNMLHQETTPIGGANEEVNDINQLQQLHVQKLFTNATIPTKATDDSAAFDLSSAIDVVIPAMTTCKNPTDLAIQPPKGTYCQILSRSGLITKHDVEVKAGSIVRL